MREREKIIPTENKIGIHKKIPHIKSEKPKVRPYYVIKLIVENIILNLIAIFTK
jgi:hypothetical protein